VRIEVLGPIRITSDEGIIRLAGQRQRALLAALTLDLGKVVSIDRLVDTLWETNPPPTARVKVRAHACALRQAMGQDASDADGSLLTQPPGYVLSHEGVELDLAEFDALTGRAKQASESRQSAVASELLAAALAMWQGSAFADVRSPLIRSAADSLEDRRLLAWEDKAEADLAMGRSDRVAAELPQWLNAHPFRERMRGLLMLALYRLGCRADALAVYRDGHQIMVTELGLELGPPLRILQQRILADDPRLLGHPEAVPREAAREALRAEAREAVQRAGARA
jgi:DNA-binding SARP family transcriptional activator